MTLTWADYKTQLRGSVLKDPDSTVIEDADLLNVVNWAMDIFAAHTAVPSIATLDLVDDETLQYVLPDDMFEPVDIAGRVYIKDADSKITYLKPINEVPGLTVRNNKGNGFYIWPDTTLNLLEELDPTDILKIAYFAYYPPLADDDDEIAVPRWSYPALNYLISALALTGSGIQSANISQWKDRQDSGQPENNALRVHIDHLWKQYYNAIARREPQDRTNFNFGELTSAMP
jgi:hypothetical protein